MTPVTAVSLICSSLVLMWFSIVYGEEVAAEYLQMDGCAWMCQMTESILISGLKGPTWAMRGNAVCFMAWLGSSAVEVGR